MLTDEENREAYRKGDAYSSQDKADVKRERNEQQPWRTEPEIDRARQKQLMQCLATARQVRLVPLLPITRSAGSIWVSTRSQRPGLSRGDLHIHGSLFAGCSFHRDPPCLG